MLQQTSFAILALAAALGLALPPAAAAAPGDPGRPWRVLELHSYHAEWDWCAEQSRGFRRALQGLKVEYRGFDLDTKRQSGEAAKQAAAARARELIDQWQPDLVYTTDDDAQKYVAAGYAGSPLPFVFSGVNAEPGDYGFDRAPNVTGVLEREHFVETVRLLREIAPGVRRIAVVLDEGSTTWDGVGRRMKERLGELEGVEVAAWDTIRTFDEFQRKITSYRGLADAVALLGVFNFRGADGKNVPFEAVLRWVAEHSPLPDFSFWDSRVALGTLCAVAVSGYEQGLAAGEIARVILVEGRSPRSFPMTATRKGAPVVSLARARTLGIDLRTQTLLSSRVITSFGWAP